MSCRPSLALAAALLGCGCQVPAVDPSPPPPAVEVAVLPEVEAAPRPDESGRPVLPHVAQVTPSVASTPPVGEVATEAEPESFDIVGQVIRGEPERARNVAVVDVERCFERIPSYRKVKDERNSREYARYLLLLAQANEEFRAAVDWIALREGFDLVVESGGVRGGQPTDITAVVCDRLSEGPLRSSCLTR